MGLTRCYKTTVFYIYIGILAPLCVNTASSAKPEVHNILHCHQRRTEPLPQVTRKENFLKFVDAVFEICKPTDRQTDRHTDTRIAILLQPTRGEVNKFAF